MYPGLGPDLSLNLTLQALRRAPRQEQVWAQVKAPEVLALAWAVRDTPVRLADKHYRDWLAPFVAHFSARAPPWRV